MSASRSVAVKPEPVPAGPSMGEVCILVLPLPTFKALSDAARARNVTVPEFLSRAIDFYITETK